MTNITHTTTSPAAAAKPRHHPMEIAPETWVIQDTHGEGVAPQVVHLNSMVIRGAEPVVVDTGVPGNRERYLEDLFSIVEPEDVRWVFISHDDVDHYGNLNAVMAACPNATLVASWYICDRISDELAEIPQLRWRWVADGEAFDAGDRTLAAVRPPLYDSPTTRGLFDSSTGVYWASDCYGTPVSKGTAFVDELDQEAWAGDFTTFHVWNSPWASLLDVEAFAVECRRVEQLRPTTIASAHGPAIEASHIQRAFELLRAVPGAGVPPQPDQRVLDQIIASITAGVSA